MTINTEHLDLRTLDLTKDSVRFHSLLLKGAPLSPRLKTILDLELDVISVLFPPVFLLKQNTYYLVGRYWIYSLHMAAKATTITALIIHDEKIIQKIKRYDVLDKQMLQKIDQQEEPSPQTTKTPLKKFVKKNRYKSRKSISIEKSTLARRICPFSHPESEHVLSTPRKKQSPDSNGLIHLRCINRSKGCDFDGMVTPFELTLLKSWDYPTFQWLLDLSDDICPNCNKNPLWKRTVRWDDETAAVYEVCRNYFSINNRCDYIRLIRG